MTFDEIIEIDALNEVFLLKNYTNETTEFIIKIIEYEYKFDELKIKKENIEFFTSQSDFKNPLACEFNITIFTKNKLVILLQYSGNNQKEAKELYEFIKSILI